MNRKHQNPEDILDQALQGIREEQVDPNLEEQAGRRVWQQLSQSWKGSARSGSSLSNCDDFQSLIPRYLEGGLSQARLLLFEDHTRHCIPCRKALKSARDGVGADVSHRQTPTSILTGPWAKYGLIAAMVILTIGLGQLGVLDQFLPSTSAGQASVYSVTGTLMRVSDGSQKPLEQGEPINLKEGIRAAKDTGAVVELGDGSLVELRERSEFSITEARDGITLNLERGSVIVRAADQRDGHLYVRTNDCIVAVKGTVFSVNSGTKGSRVSVLEGEVWVEHSRKTEVLKPGMQYSTNRRLAPVPLEREIAWSQDFDEHVALLREMQALNKEINRALFPGMRYSSRFLDAVPADTMIYVALPNLTVGLDETRQLFEARVAQNPALKDWWARSLGAKSNGHSPLELLDRLREFGSYLGDEIVISLSANENGEPENPLILAEVTDPSGFGAVLESEVNSINSEAGQEVIILTTDPSATEPAEDVVYIYWNVDVLAASPSLDALRQYQIDASTGTSFRDTAFYARLSDAYFEGGVDWLFGVDVEKVLNQSLKGETDRGFAARAGLLDVRHFIVELRENEGAIENRAMLTFDEQRKGITSWLAPPAPLGGLEFVSADANVAAAFAVKEPSLMLGELFEMVESMDQGALSEFRRVEKEVGIDVETDLAAVLGGEFVFAIDGPIIPTPSWKLIVEVYDPVQLQNTIETALETINSEMASENRQGLELTEETSGGRTYYLVTSLDTGLEAHYTYVDGYLIAAPSRVLITEALQFRQTGYTLSKSPDFIDLLPQDGQTGFSAVAYQNLQSVMQPLADMSAGANLTDEQRAYVKAIADNTKGSLICAYGEQDRILFASRGHFGLNPSSLLGLGAFQDFARPGLDAGQPQNDQR